MPTTPEIKKSQTAQVVITISTETASSIKELLATATYHISLNLKKQ